MTGLDALRDRGWGVVESKYGLSSATRGDIELYGAAGAIISCSHDVDGHDMSVRMALAAALVAEGHDLIGLLQEAREELVHWEDITGLLARVDAVLGAVDGPQ